jgi:uncharacterized protein
MVITPLQLVDEPLEIDIAIAPGEVEFAPDITQTSPLKMKGRAELLVEHRGHKDVVEDIRLRAHFAGKFEIQCARCLDAVKTPISGSFDLIFRPTNVDNESGEHAITEDETEIGYYEKSGLRLEDAVREQVLLGLPGRTLCREDCKGLCPSCGVNRNTTACDCADKPADPRWKALAGLAGTPKV